VRFWERPELSNSWLRSTLRSSSSTTTGLPTESNLEDNPFECSGTAEDHWEAMLHFGFIAALLIVLVIAFQAEAGQNSTGQPELLRYPLPSFTITALLLQSTISQKDFLNEIEIVTTSHIEATLRDQMPTKGPLSVPYFHSIQLSPALASIEQRNKSSTESDFVIATNFTGYAVFVEHSGAPPEKASFMLRAMVNLIRLSLASEIEYTKLVARYQATTVLGSLKTVKIGIDTPSGLDETDDYQLPTEDVSTLAPSAAPAPPKKSNRMLIMIIVLAVVLTAFVAYKVYTKYFKKEKESKKQSRWSKSSKELRRNDNEGSRRFKLNRDHSSGKFSSANNNSFSNNSESEDQDQWMDGMAQKMMSVKLSKPQSRLHPHSMIPPQNLPRLASARKNSLHCIMEESDESYSDASTLAEDQRQFDVETGSRPPSNALGQLHDSDDSEDSKDEIEPDGVFLQENYVTVYKDPRTRRSMIAL
jgi:hypothetical protein